MRRFFRRIYLAFACFFGVLFGRPLPEGIAVEGGGAPEPPPALGGERGAVALLALFQRDGRLVDFLLEDISGYSDEQVGAAVRDVYRGCRKVLEEHFSFEPVLGEAEGSRVSVEKGFDAAAIRLTGEVAGKPPFSGKLRHPGWRVTAVDLPALPDGIVAPAEVEL